MRTIITLLMAGMLSACPNTATQAQQHTENLHKEFTLLKDASATTLYIYNIDGFVKVQGYNGDKVLLEIDETISADDNTKLETGKKEFQLGFDQKNDSIVAYIAAPFDSRPCRNCPWKNNQKIEYHYHVDYTVKVPFAMNLHISTVNNGVIAINDVSGKLHVNNVNDKITIVNASGTTYAHTVNGDVTVNYLSNPPEQSSYYTINGNIRIDFQSDLSADLQFKSMHGDFFTDFPDAQLLPITTTKKQEGKNGGTVYKIDKTMAVRFGKGGKVFQFETLNGNVYIKKQS